MSTNNDPNTTAQAQALLEEYYKNERAAAAERGERSALPDAPRLEKSYAWDDGTIIVIDGASGRKLAFAPAAQVAPAQPKKGRASG